MPKNKSDIQTFKDQEYLAKTTKKLAGLIDSAWEEYYAGKISEKELENKINKERSNLEADPKYIAAKSNPNVVPAWERSAEGWTQLNDNPRKSRKFKEGSALGEKYLEYNYPSMDKINPRQSGNTTTSRELKYPIGNYVPKRDIGQEWRDEYGLDRIQSELENPENLEERGIWNEDSDKTLKLTPTEERRLRYLESSLQDKGRELQEKELQKYNRGEISEEEFRNNVGKYRYDTLSEYPYNDPFNLGISEKDIEDYDNALLELKDVQSRDYYDNPSARIKSGSWAHYSGEELIDSGDHYKIGDKRGYIRNFKLPHMPTRSGSFADLNSNRELQTDFTTPTYKRSGQYFEVDDLDKSTWGFLKNKDGSRIGQQLPISSVPTLIKEGAEIREGYTPKYEHGTQHVMADNNPHNDVLSYISNKNKIPVRNIEEMERLIKEQESGTRNINQIGGGPGRGYYQFEPDSLKTAFNRTKNLYKAMGKELPKNIIDEINKSGYDATKLSESTQDLLALSDMYMRPNFDFKAGATDLTKLPDVWKKGWNTRKDTEGLDRFKQNIERLGATYTPYTEPVERAGDVYGEYNVKPAPYQFEEGTKAIKEETKPPPEKEKSLEQHVDDFLGNPQTKAREYAENEDEGDPIDNIRHATAGYLTAKAMAEKLPFIPSVATSNVLGGAHELATMVKDPRWKEDRPWYDKAVTIVGETGEDMLNNLYGSMLYGLGKSEKEAVKNIQDMSFENKLPDGYGSDPKLNPMYTNKEKERVKNYKLGARKIKVEQKKDEGVSPSFPSAYGTPMYYTGTINVEASNRPELMVSVPDRATGGDALGTAVGTFSTVDSSLSSIPGFKQAIHSNPYSAAAYYAGVGGASIYKGIRDKNTQNMAVNRLMESNENIGNETFSQAMKRQTLPAGYAKYGNKGVKAPMYNLGTSEISTGQALGLGGQYLGGIAGAIAPFIKDDRDRGLFMLGGMGASAGLQGLGNYVDNRAMGGDIGGGIPNTAMGTLGNGVVPNATAFKYGGTAANTKDVAVERGEYIFRPIDGGKQYEIVQDINGDGYNSHEEGHVFTTAQEGDVITPNTEEWKDFVKKNAKGGKNSSNMVGARITGNAVYDFEAKRSKLPPDENTAMMENGTKNIQKDGGKTKSLAHRMKQEQAVKGAEAKEAAQKEWEEWEEEYRQYNAAENFIGHLKRGDKEGRETEMSKYSKYQPLGEELEYLMSTYNVNDNGEYDSKIDFKGIKDKIYKTGDKDFIGYFENSIKGYKYGTKGIQKEGAEESNQYTFGKTPYKPLSDAELEALSHQFRGEGASQRYYTKDRDEMGTDRVGRLTEREYKQLKDYMDKASTMDAFYQYMPNLLGDSGASAIPEDSRLKSALRSASGMENWGQRMDEQGYRYGTKGINTYQTGVDGLTLSPKGYAAINQFENTLGTFDASGNPIGMGMGNNYAQTGGNNPQAVADIESYIDNTIGRDTWNKLPDDIKTQFYAASFNSGANKDYYLRGLAQAIGNSTEDSPLAWDNSKATRNAMSNEEALNIIRNADYSNPDIQKNYVNILGAQNTSVGERSGFPETYMPTFAGRSSTIDEMYRGVYGNQPKTNTAATMNANDFNNLQMNTNQYPLNANQKNYGSMELPNFANYQEMQDYFRANKIDPVQFAQNRGFYGDAGNFGWHKGLGSQESEYVAAQKAGLGDIYSDVGDDYYRNFLANKYAVTPTPTPTSQLESPDRTRTGTLKSMPNDVTLPITGGAQPDVPGDPRTALRGGAGSGVDRGGLPPTPPAGATGGTTGRGGYTGQGFDRFGNWLQEAAPSIWNASAFFKPIADTRLSRMTPIKEQFVDRGEQDRKAVREQAALNRYNLGRGSFRPRSKTQGDVSAITQDALRRFGQINAQQMGRADMTEARNVQAERQAQGYNLGQLDREKDLRWRAEAARDRQRGAALTGFSALAQNRMEREQMAKRNNLQYGMDVHRLNMQRRLMGEPDLTPEEMQQMYLSPYQFV